MIEGLDLLRPWWLTALPVIATLAAVYSHRKTSLGAWDSAVEPALMAAMDKLGRVSRSARERLWLPPLIAALIAVALVGPARDRSDGAAFRNLDGIVIAVDLSKSMTESGRFQDVLTTARLVGQGAGTRQVALVVFAGDAYLASALTSDTRALGQTLALLDAETVPDQGSRPERALSMARTILSDAEILLGDVVLVTDGGGIGPEALAEAEMLAEAGAPLSALYIDTGSERGPVDALAAAGEGVSADMRDPFPVVRALDQGFERRLAATEHGVAMRVDLGRYLLLLALLPALALFRKAA